MKSDRGCTFRRSIELFALCVLVVSWPWHAAPHRPVVTLTHSATLASFAKPLTTAQLPENRVGAADNMLWLIAPDQRIQRYRGRLKIDQSWPLPKELGHADAGSLSMVVVSKGSAWIVDRKGQSLWLVEDGAWRGPFAIGEPLGSATASSDGSVILNTPENTKYLFVRVSRDGRIASRFGERMPAAVSSLDRFENAWVIAQAPRGGIVAAHAFRPLLRSYDESGHLRWEKEIAIPSMARRNEDRRIAEAAVRTNPQTCCVEAKLIHYATNVLSMNDEIVVRYGFDASLEVFDEKGEWRRTIGVTVPASPLGWPLAGLAVTDEGFAAVELSRLALYEPSGRPDEVRAKVVSPEGEGVADASVSIHASNGATVTLKTAEDGTFRLRGVPAKTPVELRVTASGFAELRRSGVLSEIAAKPIRLERPPRACILVTDESGSPIKSFHVEAGHHGVGARTVSRGEGVARDVTSDDGKACLDVSVELPIYVRVWAEGFATREARMSEAGTVNVSLAPEALLRAHVLDDEGQPVEGARLIAQFAESEDRASFAVPGDMVTTSDAHGIAELRGLDAADYRLTLEQKSFLRLEKNVRLETGLNEIDLPLDRGTRIAVSVTSSGQRVPDATVRAEGTGQRGTHPLECTSGSDGACVIEGAPPGRYIILAELTGHSRGMQILVVAPGDREAAVEVQLGNAVTLTGRVEGVEFYPGAKLDLMINKPGVPSVSSPISADGRFRINEAPSGRVNVWVYERDTDSTLLYQTMEIPDAPAHDVTIELPRPMRLTGRITSGGIGCGSCKLTLERLGSEIGRPSRAADVAGDGSYSARLPSGGDYRATASDPLSGAVQIRTLQVNGDSKVDFTLGGSTLRVTVVDAGGNPANSALVTVTTSAGTVASLTTEAEGLARFEALSPGALRVTASLGGRAVSREIDLDADTTLELRLPDIQPLQLRIIDAASGLPIPMVSAHVISSLGESAIRTSLIGRDGVFDIPAYAAQPLIVVLSARDYALKTLRGITTSAAPIPVLMMPGFRTFSVQISADLHPCSIEVRDASGSPIALALEAAPGPIPLFVRNAIFYGLEPGSYNTILHDCDGKTYSAAMQLAPGMTPEVRFP